MQRSKLNFLFFSFVLGFALFSCKQKTDINSSSALKNREELLATDKQFAAECSEKGMKNAYLNFIDSNGVLLRPNSYPIVGADAVDYIIGQKTEDLTLTWRPKDAFIANSGDLAYTYGTYKIEIINTNEYLVGSYVTIWKKQIDGKWKFVLDTNTEGLEAE